MTIHKAISKKCFILALLCFCVHLSAAHAAPAGQPQEFAIMMWGATPSSAAELKRVKENGINIAGFAAPSQFAMVEASGLQAFYWPPFDELETAINNSEIANNPAVIGYVLGSEFGMSKFAKIGAANDLFLKKYPTKIPLMNLFPKMAAPSALEAKDYQEYLDTFIKTAHPSLLCYDQYSLMEDGTVNNTYWDSLEAIRAELHPKVVDEG